jgi:hypothetical protein
VRFVCVGWWQDKVSGACVVVEQDAHAGALMPVKPAGARQGVGPVDEMARYRRLLAGAADSLRPGDFAGAAFDDDDPTAT